MSKAYYKNDTCVYCGSDKELTDDHIPPKSFFPKPRPSNLITVRSCRPCNEGASRDDEYFRLMVSMRHDTGDHPAVREILPTIYRSLQKPTKKGFKQSLFDCIGDVDVVSAGGIYLRSAPGYNVDLTRMDRVVTRITTGLFFHHFREKIPPDYHVTTYSIDGLNNIDHIIRPMIINILSKVTENQCFTIGDGVFAYCFQQAEGDDIAGAWVLEFYERVFFLCLVTKN